MSRGYVCLEWKTIEDEVGVLSLTELVDRTGLSEKTIGRATKGLRIQRNKAGKIHVGLRLKRPFEEYLASDGPHEKRDSQLERFHGWQRVGRPSGFLETINGLFYRIFKMKHDEFEDFGRGKYYDLSNLDGDQRIHLEEKLTRHARVSRSMRGHRAFLMYEDWGMVDDDHCWVIDRWEDGRTLQEMTQGERLDENELRRVMREIAVGLESLHETGVYRRELSPASILLRDEDGSVALTDLELAKITEPRFTVQPEEWPNHWNLAPEIGSQKANTAIDSTIDIFSWGQIFLYALLGKEPPRFADAKLISKLNVPQGIRNLLSGCTAHFHTGRPKSFDEVIERLDAWA